MRKKETLVLECPVASCRAPTDGIFCSAHWPLISSRTRRELFAAVKSERLRGRRKASPAVEVLLRLACLEISEARGVPVGALSEPPAAAE